MIHFTKDEMADLSRAIDDLPWIEEEGDCLSFLDDRDAWFESLPHDAEEHGADLSEWQVLEYVDLMEQALCAYDAVPRMIARKHHQMLAEDAYDDYITILEALHMIMSKPEVLDLIKANYEER